jgi:hypothetical protein
MMTKMKRPRRRGNFWILSFLLCLYSPSYLYTLRLADKNEKSAEPISNEPLDAAHKETIRRKILAASKMLTMMKTLR